MTLGLLNIVLVLPVLSETEGVSVNLLTEAAEVVAYLVVYLGELLFRLFRHFNHVELRVHVTFVDWRNALPLLEDADEGS